MKKLTKVLSLIIAVTMIFGMTLTSFATEADPVVAMGFNPNETTNSVALEIVADPLNADESAVKLPAPTGARYSYGVAGEDGATFILEDKALYTIAFDAYNYSDAEGATHIDVTFYRGKENAGKASGNKTNTGVSAFIDNLNEWQHVEFAFFADLSSNADMKYLLMTVYSTVAENSNEVLIKNFKVEKVGTYDENGYIELDFDTIPETCYIGEALDLADMKVTYVDSNGVSTVMTHSYEITYDNAAAGICELTVTLKDLTATADIEVLTPAVVPSEDNITLQLGESHKFTATTDPEALGVVWSTKDTDVIDLTADGTVVAKNYGTAEVIATITLNGKQYTATCVVDVPKPVVADDEAQAIVEDKLVFPGETFTVNVALKNIEGAKSIGIENIIFDVNALEFVGAEWLIDAEVADWNADASKGAVVFAENTDVNGDVLAITFIAKQVVYSKSAVGCEVVVKISDDDEGLVLPVTFGTISVIAADQGDVNEDRAVTAQDAVYLLYYTLYGAEEYPINQDVDFDASRNITSDDAVYLLYYVLFGAEEYPLPDLTDDGMNVNPGTPEDPDDGFGDWEPIL